MESNINVCRLCLNFIQRNVPFVLIENNDDILDKLKVVALPCIMNLNATENPIICNKCDDKIIRFVNLKNSIASSEVYIQKKLSKSSSASSSMNQQCRFCLKHSDNTDKLVFKTWNDVNTLLFQCDIKLNFEIKEPLKICNVCDSNLQEFNEFIQQCSENENYLSRHFKLPEKLKLNDIVKIVKIKNQNPVEQLLKNETILEADKTGKLHDNEKDIILQEMSRKIKMETANNSDTLTIDIQSSTSGKSLNENRDIEINTEECINDISGKIKQKEKCIILEEMSRKIQSNKETDNIIEMIDNNDLVETSLDKKSPRTYGKAKISNKTKKPSNSNQVEFDISNDIDVEYNNAADVTLTASTPEDYNPTIHGIEHDILNINKLVDKTAISSKPKVSTSKVYIVDLETMTLNLCDDNLSPKSTDEDYTIDIDVDEFSKNDREIVISSNNEEDNKKCIKQNRNQIENKSNENHYTVLNNKASAMKFKSNQSNDDIDITIDTDNDNIEIHIDNKMSKKRARHENPTVDSNDEEIIPKKKSRIINSSININDEIDQFSLKNRYKKILTYSQNKNIEISVESEESSTENKSTIQNLQSFNRKRSKRITNQIATIASSKQSDVSDNDDDTEVVTDKKKPVTRVYKRKGKGKNQPNKCVKNDFKKKSSSKRVIVNDDDENDSEEIYDLDDLEFVSMSDVESSDNESGDTKKKNTTSNTPVIRIIRNTKKTTNKAVLEQTWQELTGSSSTCTSDVKIDVKKSTLSTKPNKRGRKPKANKVLKTPKSTYFQCPNCPYKSISQNTLIQHQYIHTVLNSASNFKCSSCQFTTTDEDVFKQHQATHASSTLLYNCVFCDYNNRKKVSVMNHTLHHDDKDVANLFYCIVVDHFNTNEHYECFQCTFVLK